MLGAGVALGAGSSGECNHICDRFDPTFLDKTYVTTDPGGNTVYFRKGYHRCINNHYLPG